MSKKVLALSLVVVFVFAFATMAYAAWGDSTYITVNQIVASTGGSTNPHGPYDTASRKCAVCHAVHGADAAGSQLLRGGAADPCVYCHITSAAGGVYVYNGNEGAYDMVSNTNNEFAHDKDGGIECKGCHTVHGAGTVDKGVVGAAGAGTPVKNLKGFAVYVDGSAYDEATRPSATYGTYSVATNGTNVAAVSMTDWCSGCHPYKATGYNGPTHVMNTDANTAYNNPASSVVATVAFVNSDACTSCHAATSQGLLDTPPTSTKGVAFPHYTGGSRFLQSADDTSSPAGIDTAAGRASYDAVCLKCHLNGTGSAGVGITF